MSIKKFTDWGTWWDGLRTNLIKCIGTTGVTYLGTNALAGVTSSPSLGLGWRQAVEFFGVHIAFEVFTYMMKNQPQVITETLDTTFQSKSVDGTQISQSSKTVTTTPVNPAEPKP